MLIPDPATLLFSRKVIGGLTIENDDKASVCCCGLLGCECWWIQSENGREKEAATPELSPWPPAAQKRFTKLFMETTSGLSIPTVQHLFTASVNVLSRECARSLINHLLSVTKVAVWSPLIVCGWKPASQLKPFTEISYDLGFHCVTFNLVCL